LEIDLELNHDQEIDLYLDLNHDIYLYLDQHLYLDNYHDLYHDIDHDLDHGKTRQDKERNGNLISRYRSRYMYGNERKGKEW
jgi:hypothetical protein